MSRQVGQEPTVTTPSLSERSGISFRGEEEEEEKDEETARLI